MSSSEDPFDNFSVTRENFRLSLRCSRVASSGQKALWHSQQLNGWALPLFELTLHLLTFPWATLVVFQGLLESFSCNKVLVTVIVMVMHLQVQIAGRDTAQLLEVRLGINWNKMIPCKIKSFNHLLSTARHCRWSSIEVGDQDNWSYCFDTSNLLFSSGD